MKKRMTIMIIALVIIFGGLIAYNLLKGYMMKRYFANVVPPAVTVSTVVAKELDWDPKISSVGNLLAINGVDVNSQASGSVVAIHFDSGQYVEEGAPLIDIDDSIEQATLKSHQSELALNDLNYKRQTDLAKHGATPSSTVDEARAKLLQAQAGVEKIQSSIQQKHLRAPFAGHLGIRQVNIGQYITPGKTAIVSLQSLDPLYLEFYLPEQLYKRLHINQAIKFSVEQNPNLLFEGKITAINSKIDTNTHNIQVQATIPNCPRTGIRNPLYSQLVKVNKQTRDGRIIISCSSELNKANKVEKFNFIPGMFAAVEVDRPIRHHVVVLPTVAISYSLYGNSVYIIEKDKKDGLVAKRVFVTTGDQRGNYTVIKKGVQAGQQVVSAGELKLQNGTRVAINNSVQLLDSNPEQLTE